MRRVEPLRRASLSSAAAGVVVVFADFFRRRAVVVELARGSPRAAARVAGRRPLPRGTRMAAGGKGALASACASTSSSSAQRESRAPASGAARRCRGSPWCTRCCACGTCAWPAPRRASSASRRACSSMIADHLAEARWVLRLAPVEHVGQVAEQPGPAEAAAADDHAVAAGRAHHAQRVVGLPDVAVAEHRDAAHGLLELGDGVPARLAVVELRGGARVQRRPPRSPRPRPTRPDSR